MRVHTSHGSFFYLHFSKQPKYLMFRIGYDAKRLFNNFTGLGNYSRTLLQNMATYYPDNEYFLYTPRVNKSPETAFFLNSPLFSVHAPRRGSGAWWRSFSVVNDLKRHKIQLFHGLSHEIPSGVRKAGIPSVVTMHDLAFKRFPHFYPFFDRHIYDFKFRYACQHAERIVAISESTRNDVVEFYDIAPEKISVIYQSCHERFQQEKSQKTIDYILKKYQLPKDYLLFVGSLSERKNPLAILQAMVQLPSALQLPLVIIGDGQPYKKKIQDFAQRHKMQRKVLFIRPEYEDMPAIYQQADVFIYPSFYEGFGIPILEALFSETPVITSNVSSLPEAAGPDSWLVNPDRADEIAAGIQKILEDQAFRRNMIEKGYQYAQRFQGDLLSDQMMELYEDVLKMDAIV